MAEQLPWFPFFVNKWMTDDRVLELTGEQMAAYLWLLCLQWQHGCLPYEAHRVIPMVPRNIPDNAVVYAFLQFFPPDPDTNERRNPFLAAVREKQLATYRVRVSNIAAGRKSKQGKDVPSYEASYEDKKEKEIKKEKEDDVPTSVLAAASGYLSSHTQARVGILRGMFQGITDRPVPEAVLVRALRDMAAAGTNFTPVILRTWCVRAEKEMQGEAGRREALSPVLRQPDANHGPSEDDFE